MAKNSSSSLGPNNLRQKITDMVKNIELVMVNINNVLGEVTVLVKDIDAITERLETHFEKKVKKRKTILDANRNHCKILATPGLKNQSNIITPSPYMDYTYLELATDCDTCHDHMHSFSYNEKYPLWVQYGTWKSGTSASEISEVSSGSDPNNVSQIEDDDNSWTSVSDFEGTHENIGRINQRNWKFVKEDVVKFTQCCNSSHNCLNDKYCGVYEQIMEQQLEEPDTFSLELCETKKLHESNPASNTNVV